MKANEAPIEIDNLTRLNEYGPDDLFICCASFEERCLSSALKMGSEFRTRFAIIFVIEESFYSKEVSFNLARLQTELRKNTSEGVFIISCRRENPVDALAQLKNIWPKCEPKNHDEPYITIDISSFTKLYLLELLHYLVIELNLGIPRLLHTTQNYLPTRLTHGVEQISTVPNFFGSTPMDKQTMLVLFLGFESERTLAVWKQYNPSRTIALITNPPRLGNLDYLRYAQKNNANLLAQSNVEVRDVPADNPYGVKEVLEDIYNEVKRSYNMVIGPFGTKPQVVGVFLFCLEHPKVQVAYSFPANYTKSYLERKPGATMLLPLAPSSPS